MNYLLSFLFCGFVCVIAQLIYEYTKLTPGHITCSFVVLGALLDLFHIYDRLIKIFHAGAMLLLLELILFYMILPKIFIKVEVDQYVML